MLYITLLILLLQICLAATVLARISEIPPIESVRQQKVREFFNILEELVPTSRLEHPGDVHNDLIIKEGQAPVLLNRPAKRAMEKRQNGTESTTTAPAVISTTPVATTASSASTPVTSAAIVSTTPAQQTSAPGQTSAVPVTTAPVVSTSAGQVVSTSAIAPQSPVIIVGTTVADTTASTTNAGGAPADTVTTAVSTNAAGSVVPVTSGRTSTSASSGNGGTGVAAASSPAITSSFTGKIDVTTTDDQGQPVTLSSVSYGQVVTGTDRQGHTFVTTFTPGGIFSSMILITTDLPNGQRSTITSYAPAAASTTQKSSSRATATGTASLQSGAANAHKTPKHFGLLAGGLFGFIQLLF